MMSYTTPRRAGTGRNAGIALGLAMLVGLMVSGFAVYNTLISAPKTESESGSDGAEVGVADNQRLEELLTSVQVYVTDGNLVAAEAILTEAIREYSQDQDLRVALGELLIGLQRTDEAYDQYVAALAIGPRDAELEYRSGMLAVQLNQHQRAVEHFGAARTANPTVPEYALMLANEQLELGEIMPAKATLLQVVALDAGEPLAWGALAKIGLRQNQNSIALNHARRAIELDPAQPAYRLYEARALKRLGQSQEALMVLTALPEHVQQNAEYLRTIGECFGMLDRPGDAAARYEAAFEQSKLPAFAFQAAIWHDRDGQTETALEWAARARDLGHAQAGDWIASVNADG